MSSRTEITISLAEQMSSVERRVASGQYESASDVIRAALHALDREEGRSNLSMREGIRSSLADPRPDIPAEDVILELRSRLSQAAERRDI